MKKDIEKLIQQTRIVISQAQNNEGLEEIERKEVLEDLHRAKHHLAEAKFYLAMAENYIYIDQV